MAGAADDVFDGDAFACKRNDRGIGFLAAQIPLVLQLLRTGQQLWIDRRGADGAPNRSHRLAHRIEERSARVFHEMPAIGDLDHVRQCLRRSFAIAAAAIP
jgi:hypothetical protein